MDFSKQTLSPGQDKFQIKIPVNLTN